MAAKKNEVKKYVVTSPIKNYSGKSAAGIQFAYGKAIVYDGWVLNWFKERGYKVEEYKESSQPEKLIEPAE